MSHDTEEWCKIWRKTCAVSKMTKIWRILIWALEILKISTLIGSFCAKYITFDLKKYIGVSFYETCKIWRKTTVWFGKWHEQYGKFSPEHLKASKSGLRWGPLIQKYKIYELKIYRGVMCHEEWYTI